MARLVHVAKDGNVTNKANGDVYVVYSTNGECYIKLSATDGLYLLCLTRMDYNKLDDTLHAIRELRHVFEEPICLERKDTPSE